MKTKVISAILLCLFVSVFLAGQARPPAAEAPGTPEKQVTVTAIPGVIAAGTKVEKVWMGNKAADGLISLPDGTLVLPEQRAHRISKFSMDGKVTPWFEDTNEAGGVAIDSKGRIITVERTIPRVRELYPERKILADKFEGAPLQRLSDVVLDKKDGIYFTEGSRNSVYYLSKDGKLMNVAKDIKGANGVMLSPDEKTLYVTNTEAGILAYDVQPDATIKNRRPFVKPKGGQDGLCVDSMGRLYVAGDEGIEVFTPQGQSLGIIPIPRGTTTLAFAGPDKKTLFVLGRQNDSPGGGGGDGRTMYKISMLAQGYKGRAK
jgi:gluconolactonase